MSTQNPINNPTAHMGLRETYVGNVFFRDRDPRTRTTNDDYKSYYPGDRWINTVSETSWVLVKKIYDMGTATHQAVWVGFGGGGADLEQLTPDVGAAVVPTANNINVLGTAAQGISTLNAGVSTLQITAQDATTAVKGVATYDPTYFNVAAGVVTLIPSPVNLFWVEAPGVAQVMAPNYGYYATGGLCVFALPAVCPAGALLSIIGPNSVWSVTQGAGQQVLIGAAGTTPGVAGGLASMAFGDCLHLLCTVANTEFCSIGGVGNINLV